MFEFGLTNAPRYGSIYIYINEVNALALASKSMFRRTSLDCVGVRFAVQLGDLRMSTQPPNFRCSYKAVVPQHPCEILI